MSWIEKLYNTYEHCAKLSGDRPSPIGHTTQQAHVEITIDQNGDFRRAKIVNREDQTTLIPCTEESGGRAGQKPKNHPLCDKLQYVAGDYVKFGGEVTLGFSKDPQQPFTDFLRELEDWTTSAMGHPKLDAILSYVRKRQVVQDLIREGVLPVDADGNFLKEWTGDKRDAPPIFHLIPAGSAPEDSFVRWVVESPGQPQTSVWEDEDLIAAWIRYYSEKQKNKRGLCMVTGQETILAIQHPAKIRNAGDKAKLISSNDLSGYTFRGRFNDSDQACGVGFEATQKAHNALRWLLSPERKQAFRNGDQAIVAWALTGTSLPSLFENSAELFGVEIDHQQIPSSQDSDVGQAFAVRLRQRLAGYRSELGSTAQIVVMGLDSATPGRMAITYYRELTGSEFLDRVESWHESFAWEQNFGQGFRFIGAPSPKDIAQAAFGRQGKPGEKLSKATVERLLPCIVDARPVPWDLVESAVRRTTNRQSFDDWEWEKNLGITCALFRGYHSERGYQMALEQDRKSRDYLFGRLLAVAEHVEGRALYLADEKRETSAAKLMQRFADHPCSTWRTIELALGPYKTRLRSKSPAYLMNMEKLMDDIVCAFNGQDFTVESRLSGEFLLGYHCQRHSLRFKSEPEPTDEKIDNSVPEGE